MSVSQLISQPSYRHDGFTSSVDRIFSQSLVEHISGKLTYSELWMTEIFQLGEGIPHFNVPKLGAPLWPPGHHSDKGVGLPVPHLAFAPMIHGPTPFLHPYWDKGIIFSRGGATHSVSMPKRLPSGKHYGKAG